MPITLVLADSHPIVLDGLEYLLGLQPDLQILACCKDGNETLQAVHQHGPDVLVVDALMRGTDGLAVLEALHKEKLPTRVVLLTVGLGEDQMLEAIRFGVRGIVLKEMASHLLIECIRKVHAGEQWLERRAIDRAMEKLLRREAAAREIAKLLTPREREIMYMLVADNMNNREISDKLYISKGTVKVHLHHIYDKLHVRTHMDLMRYARDKGLI